MDMLSALANSSTSIELLSQLSDELIKRGYVKEGYCEALLEREKTYPTGLSFNHNFNIAIPHTNIGFTQKEVMIVAKTRGFPISFYKMDNPTETIEVKIIFLFAIKESKRYIQFLSNFLELLNNPQYQNIIIDLPPKNIVHVLNKEISQYDFSYKGSLL